MQTDYSKYCGHTISCSCGKIHLCDIEDIIIEENALEQIPGLITKGGSTYPCILEDTNTAKAAGDLLVQILEDAGIAPYRITLPAEGLLPDEYGIGSVLTYLPAECDLLIAAGSGTLNDLARFVSYKLGIPYYIAGTAPSMDGFTSSVAAMITNHTKTTYEAHKPLAVIGDLNILSKAPMDLIAAGVGDILGKYVCLTDWKISHLITGEYFCPEVEALVRKSIEKVSEAVPGLARRDKSAIAGLMDGLVLSGIAMSYIGNSRPASGSEHHLSHYWEMMFLQEGKHGAWHGTKVGIGTVIALALYQKLADFRPDFVQLLKYRFDDSLWGKKIELAYGAAAPSVIALEKETDKNSVDAVVSRVRKLEENWDEIQLLVKALPAPDSIASLLSSLGAPCSPAAIEVTKGMLINSVLYGKDLRNRYGLLQLIYDLQVKEDYAVYAVENFYSL